MEGSVMMVTKAMSSFIIPCLIIPLIFLLKILLKIVAGVAIGTRNRIYVGGL